MSSQLPVLESWISSHCFHSVFWRFVDLRVFPFRSTNCHCQNVRHTSLSLFVAVLSLRGGQQNGSPMAADKRVAGHKVWPQPPKDREEIASNIPIKYPGNMTWAKKSTSSRLDILRGRALCGRLRGDISIHLADMEDPGRITSSCVSFFLFSVNTAVELQIPSYSRSFPRLLCASLSVEDLRNLSL